MTAIINPAPVPPSVNGIPQPVMITTDTVEAEGTIADGTTEIELPSWFQLDTITASGVASVAAARLWITVEAPEAATIHFAFGLGGGPPVEVQSMNVLANTPTAAFVQVGSPLPQTFAFYISSSERTDTPTVNWTDGSIQVVSSPTMAGFPEFVPIVPPPLFSLGGGPPPNFPPPTPPPIGVVPPGVLVGPAIAPAGVPPSTPGFVQPRFGTGSATTPAGYFPSFTTAPYAGFPNQPPAGVPIVFSNIYTGGATPVTPPHTTTTAVITQSSTLIASTRAETTTEEEDEAEDDEPTPRHRGRRRRK